MSRAREVFRQLLICKDQTWQVRIVGAAYLARLTHRCPSADETISSYVGRALLRGSWWAPAVAAFIDSLFVLAGEPAGHCISNIEPQFMEPIATT